MAESLKKSTKKKTDKKDTTSLFLQKLEGASVANPHQFVKNYVVAHNFNQRQWSASTKTRAEVSHSTRKVRPQKGSGNARLGTFAAPQCVGGGIAGGPKPKFNQERKVNAKEKALALAMILHDKLSAGSCIIIDKIESSSYKTKSAISFLNQYDNIKGKILFVYEGHPASKGILNFRSAIKNVEKVTARDALSVSAYELLSAGTIFVTKGTLEILYARSRVKLMGSS